MNHETNWLCRVFVGDFTIQLLNYIYGDYFIAHDNDPGYPNMVGDGETGLGMFGHTCLYNIQRLLGRYRCFIDFFFGRNSRPCCLYFWKQPFKRTKKSNSFL